jgi:hypothetical protein
MSLSAADMEGRENDASDLSARDFSTISPSAKALLCIKGETNIPFAKQAASLLPGADKYKIETGGNDFNYLTKLAHFERRYWSINQLLADVKAKNILEFSSGFSFRGLDLALNNEINYIDTDLPEIIEVKKSLIEKFALGNPFKGKFNLLPLNVLNGQEFSKIADMFPEGEITVVNEGLLMYLNPNEKEELCRNILNALKKRGGCWITADVYIKNKPDSLGIANNSRSKKFFEDQKIEENKFSNFAAARVFFENAGFVVEKEAETDIFKISAAKSLMKNLTEEEFERVKSLAKVRATWLLRPAK